MGIDRLRRPLASTLVGLPVREPPSAPAEPAAPVRRRRRRFSGCVTGPEIRRDIERAGPAFLSPHLYAPEQAFRSLVIVLHAYALGSRTATRLIHERRELDERWIVPSRSEALEIVTDAATMRQYLPHLLGNVMARTAAPCSGSTL